MFKTRIFIPLQLILIFLSVSRTEEDHSHHNHLKEHVHTSHSFHNKKSNLTSHKNSDTEHNLHSQKAETHKDHEGYDDDTHSGHEHHEEHKVSFTPQEMKEYGIILSHVEPGVLKQFHSYPGELRFNEEKMVHINPRFLGFVRTVEKRLGEKVKKGEILAKVDSLELGEARAKFLESQRGLELIQQEYHRVTELRERYHEFLSQYKAGKSVFSTLRGTFNEALGNLYKSLSRLELARQKFKREKSLYDEKVSSQEVFLEAQSELEKAETDFLFQKDEQSFKMEQRYLSKKRQLHLSEIQLESTRNKLNLFGLSNADINSLSGDLLSEGDLTLTSILSPLDGRIVGKHIVKGERLTPEETVFTIADLSDFWGEFLAQGEDAGKLVLGQEVVIHILGYEISSIVDYVSYQMEGANRSFKVRTTLPLKPGFKDGLFFRADVLVSQKPVQLSVPKSSVFELHGKKIVFQLDNDHFKPAPVLIGEEDETNLEILSGLSPGETIVTEGGFHIKSEILKDSLGDGHNH